jgi:ubiquitin carboxyl-terminal hydrolase 14
LLQADKLVLFKGSAKLAELPPYLTVQMVRFFYKVDVRQKAKILRKVSGPHRALLALEEQN